jgi:hypothetical protein
MRKSTVLFVLVSIVCATAAGCSPYADRGPVAFAPRLFPYVPQAQTNPPTTLPDDPPVSIVQR